MSDVKIQEYRDSIDSINLEILQLLSKRASVVSDIGKRQTELGQKHYDPKRESEMLEKLEAVNPGPFAGSTIK